MISWTKDVIDEMSVNRSICQQQRMRSWQDFLNNMTTDNIFIALPVSTTSIGDQHIGWCRHRHSIHFWHSTLLYIPYTQGVTNTLPIANTDLKYRSIMNIKKRKVLPVFMGVFVRIYIFIRMNRCYKKRIYRYIDNLVSSW